jgi:arylsulfatase A-like enzyme
MLVSWPGQIKAGSSSADMINLLDIFATICELTDGNLPAAKEVAPDSHSFLSSLLQRGDHPQRSSMVTADANGMQAIRMGDWKYIDDMPPATLPENRRKQLQDFSPALYHLTDDPGEEKDLFNERPDVVEELKGELNRIRQSNSTR